MLAPFELLVPNSLDEAITLYADKSVERKIFAGGTDVLVEMHGGEVRHERLIDIKNLPELKGFECSPAAGLTMGALTTHRQLELSDEVHSRYTALFEGASQVGSVQIRCRGTVGGNLCNAAPSGDCIGPLMALGAVLTLCGPEGERDLPLEEFFTGAKKTALHEAELLVRIHVPALPPRSGSAYTKFSRRKAMDLALLGASAVVSLAEDDRICLSARVSLTTAAPAVMRAQAAEAFLAGKMLTDAVIKKAGEIASAESRPRSSWRAQEGYRREVLKTIVARTVALAYERAQAQGAGR